MAKRVSVLLLFALLVGFAHSLFMARMSQGMSHGPCIGAACEAALPTSCVDHCLALAKMLQGTPAVLFALLLVVAFTLRLLALPDLAALTGAAYYRTGPAPPPHRLAIIRSTILRE